MTELAQFAALRTWLLVVTGLPEIIRAHPSGARPTGVYGMLNLIGSERVNWPDDFEYEAVEDPGDGAPFEEIPVEEWAYTWSFNAYGAGCADALARVVSTTQSAAALAPLRPLTLHDTSAIRRIPEMIEERWEERAQMDLTVHAVVRHRFPVDVAEGVTVTIGDNDAVIPPST